MFQLLSNVSKFKLKCQLLNPTTFGKNENDYVVRMEHLKIYKNKNFHMFRLKIKYI